MKTHLTFILGAVCLTFASSGIAQEKKGEIPDSRKTPAEWHAEADANSDGVLSKQEFVTFLGSTAHLDTFFKRADNDHSRDLSVADVASFIDSILR